MIWGVVKQKQSVEVIGRRPYRKLQWKRLVKPEADAIKPRLELTKAGVYQIYQLDDFLFRERTFEKNDHEYRISFD